MGGTIPSMASTLRKERQEADRQLREAIAEANRHLPIAGVSYSPTIVAQSYPHWRALNEVERLVRIIYGINTKLTDYKSEYAQFISNLLKYIESAKRKINYREFREDNVFVPVGSRGIERRRILLLVDDGPRILVTEVEIEVY